VIQVLDDSTDPVVKVFQKFMSNFFSLILQSPNKDLHFLTLLSMYGEFSIITMLH